MRLAGRQSYLIVANSEKTVRVCLFRRQGAKYKLVRWTASPGDPGNPGAALRRAIAECGGSISGCMLLTGSMPGGAFFRCEGANLSVREQKRALEFELPAHMIQLPERTETQFLRRPDASGGPDMLNVYAFSSVGLDKVAAMLTQARCKMDEYLYPLLGAEPTDPPVRLPEIEPDFRFVSGEWQPIPPGTDADSGDWVPLLNETLILPNPFPWKDWMACLLVMRLVAGKAFARSEASVRVMPSQLRPSRYRLHAGIAIVLSAFLLGGWLFGFLGDKIEAYRAYDALQAERDSYRNRAANLKRLLKRSERERKDLEHYTSLTAGDPDFLAKLDALAAVLPQDVLVSSFRMNGGDLDLALQTENRDLSFSEILKKLPHWKVARLQQRNMDDTLMMINVKLTPAEEEK